MSTLYFVTTCINFKARYFLTFQSDKNIIYDYSSIHVFYLARDKLSLFLRLFEKSQYTLSLRPFHDNCGTVLFQGKLIYLPEVSIGR